MLTKTLRSLVLIVACCLSSVSVALADAPQRPINIPAGDLNTALELLSKQSGTELVFRPEQVKGLKTKGVHGTLSVPEAIKKLLVGTGLELSTDSTGAMLIAAPQTATHGATTRLAPSAADVSGATHLAQSTTTSTQSQATPDVSENANGPDSKSSESQTAGLAEIVVTGTNITGVENKTVPLLVFDRDAIDRSGYATTEEFILSLPQNVKSGGNSADGVLSGQGLQNIENSTAANLRGLGASSTLTLLNGHRVAPSSYGTGVDLSMIPLSAVERIEVLTDGSSAVYGADAVGGVINIILRKDFNGQESSARFDSLTQGGGEQKQIGQSIGRTWDTGGALAVLQFQDTNAIHAGQRSFTVNLPEPTDIYPSSKRYSGVFSAHQTLPASLELYSDVLVEHNDSFRAYNTGGDFAETQLSSSKTDSQSANVGLRWQPFGDWHLEGDTLFSQVNTNTFEQFSPPSFGYTNGTPYLRNLDTIEEGDLKLDGTLWSSGGSSVKAAVGGSYRSEDFSSLVEFLPLDRAVDRHIHAAYAEIYAPLISSANSIFLVRKLEFSAAVRNDHYSDFGSKTNPRFGVFWAPIDQVGLRAAYSTSFRAPNPSEIVADLTSTNLFVQNGYPLPNDPNGNGNVLFFGNQVLGPESSRNLSAGLDYAPVEATKLSINYYRIVYTNRIINAPQELNVFVNPQVYGSLIRQFGSDAAVDAFVAGLEPPQTLIDLTPGGTGLAGVRYGFPYGYINAAKQTTEGFDIGSHSMLSMGGNNKLVLDLNATYIRDLETTFCNACTSTDLVNTTGDPLKFRIRGGGGWSNGIWSANAAVNFSNAYSDTNVVPTGRIASFTTVDMNASWHIPSSATTVGINVTNLFNIDPPRTAPALNGVEYDPSNADPRGRILSLQVRQKW
jgi:iron complex outermembrane recepter protein